MAILMANEVQWAYTVTVTNRTDDVFDEITIFYKLRGETNVRITRANTVIPEQRVVFELGPCGAMLSYTMGLFIGNDLVGQLPDQGEMDRNRASQMNPTDRFICEDSWSIEP